MAGVEEEVAGPARRDRQVRPTGPSWDGARRQRGEQVAVGGRKWLWQSLLADGYTEEQAAGILGNLEQESGFNPLADQPNGPGRGIAQWSEGARWSNLTAWANKQGLDPNKLTTQYQFMRHEMKTGTFTDGRWSDAAFRKLKTVQQATDYFGANYEIFGERGPRDQYAANWYASFAGKVGAGRRRRSPPRCRCGTSEMQSSKQVKKLRLRPRQRLPVALVGISTSRNTPTWSRAIGTHRCVGGIRSATILAPTQGTSTRGEHPGLRHFARPHRICEAPHPRGRSE